MAIVRGVATVIDITVVMSRRLMVDTTPMVLCDGQVFDTYSLLSTQNRYVLLSTVLTGVHDWSDEVRSLVNQVISLIVGLDRNGWKAYARRDVASVLAFVLCNSQQSELQGYWAQNFLSTLLSRFLGLSRCSDLGLNILQRDFKVYLITGSSDRLLCYQGDIITLDYHWRAILLEV